jgi:hypothetical protein
MSVNSRPQKPSLDIGRAAAVIAFADSSPFETATAVAIRALALRAQKMQEDSSGPKSVSDGDDQSSPSSTGTD